MRILMLGNSYIFTNDLPAMLEKLTGAEVTAHTRGGARLAEQLNPKTKLGARTLAALEQELREIPERFAPWFLTAAPMVLRQLAKP